VLITRVGLHGCRLCRQGRLLTACWGWPSDALHCAAVGGITFRTGSQLSSICAIVKDAPEKNRLGRLASRIALCLQVHNRRSEAASASSMTSGRSIINLCRDFSHRQTQDFIPPPDAGFSRTTRRGISRTTRRRILSHRQTQDFHALPDAGFHAQPDAGFYPTAPPRCSSTPAVDRYVPWSSAVCLW